MSFWTMMNWVAWGLCGILLLVIAVDVVRQERGSMETEQIANTKEGEPRVE